MNKTEKAMTEERFREIAFEKIRKILDEQLYLYFSENERPLISATLIFLYQSKLKLNKNDNDVLVITKGHPEDILYSLEGTWQGVSQKIDEIKNQPTTLQ